MNNEHELKSVKRRRKILNKKIGFGRVVRVYVVCVGLKSFGLKGVSETNGVKSVSMCVRVGFGC